MVSGFLFGGFRIIEDSNMSDAAEDWSGVRSPSRAARRRKKHRQNIVIRHVAKRDVIATADALIMHPDIAAELRLRVRERSP